jgi:hypothetical protein
LNDIPARAMTKDLAFDAFLPTITFLSCSDLNRR